MTSSARAQDVLWSDDFESGHDQWSTTGFWHWIRDTNDCAVYSLPFPSGSHVMWYGVDGQCNYANAAVSNSGLLAMLPQVFLPNNGQRPVLRYKWWREAEFCEDIIYAPFDWTEVRIYKNGALATSYIECLSSTTWRKGRKDLTPYLGTSVNARFWFDTIDDVGNQFRGVMIDDVTIQLEAGRSYCEVGACPCDPNTSPSHSKTGGCLNSASTTTGAELWGSGTPSVANDDVVLKIEDMTPNSVVTFLQGDQFTSVVFGDGVRCVGGNIMRLGTKVAVDGAAEYPGPSDLSVSVKGMIAPGGATVGYQGHYRDNGVHCTVANFNLTNGYDVHWIP